MGTRTMSRRQFFKRAVGAGSATLSLPYFIPAGVLGGAGLAAASDRIVLGCIGLGWMGTGNMKNFLARPNVKVVAVCDVDVEHRNAARDIVNKKYGNRDCAAYNDFRELLAREDIDAVSIATPDHWHAIPAVKAARRGKDIYGEKPLAYNIAEGRAICDALEKYGAIWQTGSWQRSQFQFRRACELVRNGRIGNVHTVTVGLPYGNGGSLETKPSPVPEGFDYDTWLGPAPWAYYCAGRCHFNFRWISDYAGGQITDWAGHHCDIAQWGMGTEYTAPIEVKGKGVFPRAENGLYDTIEAYRFECKYAEGFTMIVCDVKQHPKGNMGTLFEGSEGWLYVRRGFWDAHPKSILQSTIGPNETHLYESDDHIGNFLDCVRTRKQTIAPAEVAHHSIMIGHLGIAAMKLGRTLKWDPKKEVFTNDTAANRLLSRPMRSPWRL